jgi:alanine dehydrogenase
MKIKMLDKADVTQCVSMSEAIKEVKNAYIRLSHGEAVLPLRTPLPVEEQRGTTLFMPAHLSSSDSLGVKIVSIFPGNLEKGLPTIHAIVVLMDATTGQPTAVMDGTYMTALRTGAASGVATDLLSRKDSRVAAIIGAGAQGRTQLEAVCTVRKIDTVTVYDKNAGASESFVEEMRHRGEPIPPEVTAVRTPSEAVRNADIICAATTSLSPVFDDADIKPGTHINGIGSYTPEMQEIPEETVVRSKVVVDSLSACLSEAGDLIIPITKGLLPESGIHGEIGQVASGELPGRQSPDEITFFKSVGLAVQDMAVAEFALRKARETGGGQDVEL